MAGRGTTQVVAQQACQVVGETVARDAAGRWVQVLAVGARVASVRDRMPDDLRRAPTGPEFHGVPFTSLYQLGDE